MLVAGAGGVFAAGAEAATFDSQIVRVTEEFGGFPGPNLADVMVDDGPELQGFGFLNFDVDIGANSIDLLANASLGGPGGLFGFGFADVNATISRIVSVVIGSQSGFAGLDSTALSIVENGDKIVVDFGSAVIGAGDRLRLDVTFDETPGGVIPLPATLPLTLGGFAALAAFRRRRPA